jgi:transcriptional regulator with XRE-family HTH domain
VELRRLRDARALTLDEAAARLDWSPSKLSRIENARIGARVEDVRLLLAGYGVEEPRVTDVIALAQVALAKGWWSEFAADLSPEFASFIAFEDEADAELCYESNVVPGLLQTEDYAHEVIKGFNALAPIPPGRVSRAVAVRMRRQRLLVKPKPLTFSVVLDESVLLRRVGDDDTMHRQLSRIIELAQLPGIDLRILPLNSSGRLFIEPFMLLAYSALYEVTFPDVIHIENLFSLQQSTDESLTHQFRLALTYLQEQALDPADSIALVSNTAQSRWKP